MQLAQLNIAKAKYPLDAPEFKDFVDNLDPVNAQAEASAGFVWRLKDDSGNATGIGVEQAPDLLINMSVWADVQSLKDVMFRTHHLPMMKRKQEWFYPSTEATYVLWWVPDGHIPSLHEAFERLALLRAQGETAQAFSFKQLFAPGSAG
jgi:hypothetical protein